MKVIPTSVTQQFGRQILVAQKNAPRWLFVAGIIGVVGSSVLACRATLKLPEALDEFREELDEVKHDAINQGNVDHNKDVLYVYTKNTLRIARMYGPAILLGGASIAALTTSHVTISRRNVSLTAAYSGLQTAYDAYRERVREEVGKERELDIYQNARIEKVMVDGVETDVRVTDPNKHSIYARFFDEGSRNWVKNAEHNLMFIKCQQNYANDLLQARGHIFLNEVYDMLGIDRSQAGQHVGWVISKTGDNFVDFGIYDESAANFIRGWEPRVLLDFNVDGVIWDKI